MKKNLLFWLIGIVSLVVVIVLVVGFFIGPIVKTAVETLGPQITKVSIKLDGVSVSLLSGSAQVQGLVVGNPEGFKTPQLLKLSSTSVSLDPFSVFSDKIVVRAIHVKSPEITYEGGFSGNNISALMNNVNAVASKGGPPASNTGASNKPAQKIEVDDFLITGAKVHVFISGLSNKEITLPLPDIHLTNLGKDSNGITPTELIRTVLSHVSASTVKVVTHTITSSGKVLTGLGKEVGGQAKESLKSITKDIKGLFGK